MGLRLPEGTCGGGGRAEAASDALLRPCPAPPLQASAPGSAVDYPLQGLELHTNYTATVHGLRGPNLTSPASIVFTTGTSWEGWDGEGRCKEGPHLHLLLPIPLPGLEGPRDLEAKEVTPRTALLTWTEPQVLPTGYLLTYDTPDGQTQVPHPCPLATPLPGFHSRGCLCLCLP